MHNFYKAGSLGERHFTWFDYLVIAGGLINMAVVSIIFAYWLFK